jgi:virginiamycin B lyase
MVSLPEPQMQEITQYLATNFPPRNDRAPRLVAGNFQIDIQEWTAPTLGQRVRDPHQAPDGSIWWTGMFASLLGRLDPATGEMREFKLDPTARPHWSGADAQGNIWYTGNGNGTVGRLDPRTGQITVYDVEARDPHTGIFDRDGNLVWTAQGAAMVGKLNPRTGEIVEVPTQGRNPYGIRMDSQGMLWVAFNGSPMIAKLNPRTMELQYFNMPDPETRIRRLDVDSQDKIWFVNSALGRIGRLDPVTGNVREWESPSGPESHPYALEIIDDIIWYNESNQRPDALVRFDPATETFQSWPIPSGYGIVRNMAVTRDGNLLIHQSSSNRIGLVRIGDVDR